MNFNIELPPEFKKGAKKLSKKYPSLKTDLAELFDLLAENPTSGAHLGNNIFKVRMAIGSKRKGKSGGARIITYARISESVLLLLSIYDKGDQEVISDQELKELVKKYVK